MRFSSDSISESSIDERRVISCTASAELDRTEASGGGGSDCRLDGSDRLDD
jgi:hypothetical protein